MAKEKKPPNLKTFISGTLRRASYRWPPRNDAIKAARVERGLYKCANCGGHFKTGQFQVDHKVPVVSISDGFTNFDNYIYRMFPQADGWQILCTTCHDIKTKIEDALREKNKENRKKK